MKKSVQNLDGPPYERDDAITDYGQLHHLIVKKFKLGNLRQYNPLFGFLRSGVHYAMV